MTDDNEIDARLTNAGRKWRAMLPPVPDHLGELGRAAHRRPRATTIVSQAMAALLVIAVVALAAAAILGRPNLLDVAAGNASPSSTAKPSFSSSPQPSAGPEGSHEPSSRSPATTGTPVGPVTPTPLVTPTPTATLPQYGDGFGVLGPGLSAAWSPDSQLIAIQSGDEGVLVTDREGNSITDYRAADGGGFLWLDSTRLLLRDSWGEPVQGAANPVDDVGLYVVTARSRDFERINPSGYRGFPVAAAAGRVAFAGYSDTPSLVWDNGQWSDALPGYPLGWSQDGSLLALLDVQERTPIEVIGTLFVVRWPSLEVVLDTDVVTGNGAVHFDPGGSMIAFSASGGQVTVADLASGRVTEVGPKFGNWRFAWNDAGHLLVGNFSQNSAEPPRMDEYAPDGTRLATWEGVDAAVASPGGRTVALFNSNTDSEVGQSELIVLRGSEEVSLTVPSRVTDGKPAPAPDGHAVVVFAMSDQGQLALLAEPFATPP